LQSARVERWDEPAGTAALAGRDLPPAPVLAADANLTALARQLKRAGVPGTLDTLRAQAYLALLTGTPLRAPLRAGPEADRPDAATRGGAVSGAGTQPPADASTSRTPPPADAGNLAGLAAQGRGGHGGARVSARAGGVRDDRTPGAPGGAPDPGDAPGAPDAGGGPSPGDAPGAPSPDDVPGPWDAPGAQDTWAIPAVAGNLNLTIPLDTWLGLSGDPGHAPGFGPLDADDSRTLAAALVAHPATTTCLSITGPNGRPLAHGCARASPHRSARHHVPGSRDRPETGDTSRTWTFTLTLLGTGGCDHAWETPGYQPSDPLRHLAQARHVTCTFPGCRRPASQCDADHTQAYDDGGRTCLCNLAPLCRRHHQVKQAHGWALSQGPGGTMTWTTPAGRRYQISPGQQAGHTRPVRP
jgi:hypothetical protein